MCLHLPEEGRIEHEVIIEAIKAWFQTRQQWLLLLDNVDDLDLVSPFLPPRVGGHVPMTTRAWDMQQQVNRFEMEPFSDEQEMLLLAVRAGILAAESGWEQLFEEDRRTVLALAHGFAGLPLALDQAGAYIEATGCGLKRFLRK